MSFKMSLGLVAASALAQGCSSSASAPRDSGVVQHRDANAVVVATEDGGDGGGGPLVYDGTSGQACKADADCTKGPGINKCSSDFGTSVLTNVKIQPYTTPVCIVPPPASSTTGNCDPAPAATDPMGQSPHFCDGPDMPGSAGICLPLTSPATSGLGICLPACSFALDGSQPMCAGKNACVPFTVVSDTKDNATGYGFCQASCLTDGDCSGLGTGYVCQTDIGACTKTPVKRTKAIGAACAADPSKVAGNDSATGACNCLPDPTTFVGYCSTSCIVGGSSCPSGWVCDNGLPNAFQLPDGTVLTVSKENVGTEGQCMPACSMGDAGTAAPALDSGGASDGASSSDASGPGDGGGAVSAAQACPGSSVCTLDTPAGPDCVP